MKTVTVSQEDFERLFDNAKEEIGYTFTYLQRLVEQGKKLESEDVIRLRDNINRTLIVFKKQLEGL
jgi:hypothetical protein